MTSPAQNSPDLLCEEILADARRAADETLRRARDQAAAIIAKATADADTARCQLLDQARAEAARRSELILATVPVESGRMRSARINELLESIHDDIRRRLLARDGFDYRETIIALAAEALRRMDGEQITIKFSAADRELLDDAARDEIKRRAGRPNLLFRIESSAEAEAGVIVQDAEGRQIWDNRLASRLERMWPEIQLQIALKTGLVSGGIA